MKSALLSAVAATALLVTSALAQDQPGQTEPGTPMQNEAAGAPADDAANQDAMQPSGQATGAVTCLPGQPECPPEAGAAPASDANVEGPNGQDTTAGQTGGADADAPNAADAQTGAQSGEAQQQDQAAEEDKASEEPPPATAPAEITPQHTKVIRERIIERRDYDRVDIDIEINIGVGVPRHIEFYPLPAEIIEIVPIYQGYLFCILEDGTILIIHPAEYEIVYIIYA